MTAILIVEDDVLTKKYLEFILQQAGYEVLSATSADETAAFLEDREDVQLIVTDINLPGSVNDLKLAAAAKAKINWQRGPLRLWIVAAVAWCAVILVLNWNKMKLRQLPKRST